MVQQSVTASDLEATVMALRETLMEYFKGTCVEKMTRNSNVNLYPISERQRGLSRAERWRLSFKRPRILLLADVPLATVGQEPDTITIHTAVMGRSPQLKKVRKELEKFLKTYLPGVEIKEMEGSVFYG